MIEIKVVLKRFEFLQWAQFCGFLNRTDFCPTMQRSAAPGQQIKSGRCIKSLNQHLVLSCKIDPCCLSQDFLQRFSCFFINMFSFSGNYHILPLPPPIILYFKAKFSPSGPIEKRFFLSYWKVVWNILQSFQIICNPSQHGYRLQPSQTSPNSPALSAVN